MYVSSPAVHTFILHQDLGVFMLTKALYIWTVHEKINSITVEIDQKFRKSSLP